MPETVRLSSCSLGLAAVSAAVLSAAVKSLPLIFDAESPAWG
jgi:hypothetical protein